MHTTHKMHDTSKPAFVDRYGLSLHTGSQAAVAAYLDGVERLLASDGGAEDAFIRAIAADADFALAHIGRARCLQTAGRTTLARSVAEHAVSLVADAAVSDRERSHTHALALAVAGHSEALSTINTHLARYPRDVVAMMPAVTVFGPQGFSGRAQRNEEQLAFMTRVLPELGDDWWFSAWYSFIHTETGQLEQGRRLALHALSCNPRNANAIHALAHSFYEAGDSESAARMLEAWLPGYGRGGTLHCHLSWHHALAELECDRPDTAWRIYHDSIAPQASTAAPPINTLTDSTSFLWRAALVGQAAPASAWNAVRAFARQGYPTAVVPYTDLHGLIACLGAGDQDAVDTNIARLQQAAETTYANVGPVVPRLADAFSAFARADYAGVIAGLSDQTGQLVRVGGSVAQRDLFLYTLLAALVRAGCLNDAQVLLARDAASPRPRHNRPELLAAFRNSSRA